MKKVLVSLSSAAKRDTEKKAHFLDKIWQTISSLSDNLSVYLGEALEHSNLTADLLEFF